MNQVYSDYPLFTVLYRRNDILLTDHLDPQTPEKLVVVYSPNVKCPHNYTGLNYNPDAN